MVNAGLCAVVPGNGSTLSEHSEEPGSLDMVIQGDHSCLIRGWHYLVLAPFIKITDLGLLLRTTDCMCRVSKFEPSTTDCFVQIVLFVENVIVYCLRHLGKYILILFVQIFSVKGSFLSEKGGGRGEFLLKHEPLPDSQ